MTNHKNFKKNDKLEPLEKVSLLDYDDGGKEVIDHSKTKVKKKTINPSWEEEFTFNVKPNKSNILFEVYRLGFSHCKLLNSQISNKTCRLEK